jgi:tRNA(fMet)-specific endonuclease VapC
MVLDTCILIANERGRFALDTFLADHGNERGHIAAITVAELWHGVERATPQARRMVREEHVRRLMERMQVLPYGAEIARRHAIVWAELQSRGCVIGEYDLLIAATVLHHDHRLATLNAREFQRVFGVRLVDVEPYVKQLRSTVASQPKDR